MDLISHQPDEIILKVLSLLDVKSLCAIRITSRKLMLISKDNSLKDKFYVNRVSTNYDYGAHIVDGELFGWGSNVLGEIGYDHSNLERLDVNGHKVHKVITSQEFIVALTESMNIYFWKNHHICLSRNLLEFDKIIPCLFDEHLFVDIFVDKLDLSVYAISVDGSIYMWCGSNLLFYPQRISVHGDRVIDCFYDDCFGFITSKGKIYANVDQVTTKSLPTANIEHFTIDDRFMGKDFSVRRVVRWNTHPLWIVVLTSDNDLLFDDSLKLTHIQSNVIKAKVLEDAYIVMLLESGIITIYDREKSACVNVMHNKVFTDFDAILYSTMAGYKYNRQIIIEGIGNEDAEVERVVLRFEFEKGEIKNACATYT